MRLFHLLLSVSLLVGCHGRAMDLCAGRSLLGHTGIHLYYAHPGGTVRGTVVSTLHGPATALLIQLAFSLQ